MQNRQNASSVPFWLVLKNYILHQTVGLCRMVPKYLLEHIQVFCYITVYLYYIHMALKQMLIGQVAVSVSLYWGMHKRLVVYTRFSFICDLWFEQVRKHAFTVCK